MIYIGEAVVFCFSNNLWELLAMPSVGIRTCVRSWLNHLLTANLISHLKKALY